MVAKPAPSYSLEELPGARVFVHARNMAFVNAVEALPSWQVRDLTLTYDEHFDGPGVEGWRQLVRLERLADVTALTLPDSHSDMVRLFVEGGRVRGLESLTLQAQVRSSATPVDRWGALALSGAEAFPRLRHLGLRGARLGTEGLAELRAAPFLGRLESLDLHDVQANVDGMGGLLSSFPEDCRLSSLTVGDPELGPDIIDAIADTPVASSLTQLDLTVCPLGQDWSALARLRCPRLETLTFYGADLGESALSHLTELRMGSPALRELELGLYFLEEQALRDALGGNVAIGGECGL